MVRENKYHKTPINDPVVEYILDLKNKGILDDKRARDIITDYAEFWEMPPLYSPHQVAKRILSNVELNRNAINEKKVKYLMYDKIYDEIVAFWKKIR